MRKLKIQSAGGDEKGIALIFTLIMLSLLMILALSFALDSMFEQKAAYNSASSSSSGFMAQAQLKQVLLLMKEGEANFDSDGYLYSHDSGSVTDTDMLVDRLPVAGVLDSTDACLNPTVNINWNYVKDADGSIIGRTAFVVVPEDKIPLDSLLDDRVGTTAYPKHDEKDDTETRIGKYVSEINVRAAIPAVTTNISTITETLNWKTDNPIAGAGFANGKYTGSWLSFSSLFSTVNAAISPDLSAADETEFESKLTLTVADDEEAFWADLNDDKSIGSSEIYKRFDLTRADWDVAIPSNDPIFLKVGMLLISGAGTSPNLPMQAWADTPSDGSSYGLPWLACFGYKADGTLYTGSELDEIKGTFTGTDAVYNRSCQIAANLKDYSDTDDRPTSNVVPTETNWKATAPDYTGNEETPYINKIGVRVETQRINDTFMGNDSVYIKPIIKPVVGLINIYDKDFARLKVFISGSVTVEISTDGGTTYGFTNTVSFSRDVNFETTSWGGNTGHSYLILGDPDDTTITVATGVGCFSTTTTVKVTDVTIDKVILHNYTSSDAYDYVQALALTPDFIAFPDSSSAGEQTSWFGFAVHDPRQNLNVGDWQALDPFVAATVAGDDNPSKTFSVVVGNPPYRCSPNSENNLAANGGSGGDTEAPTVGPDPETATDPANGGLSTAYIRNDTMESPWELGFIHRGAKWETLNLKKYDSSKAIKTFTIGSNSYIAGGGLYADGDANILDQIKMTANAESSQKINLSSQVDETFDALFYKVKLGCDIVRSSTPANHMTVKSMAGLAAPPTGTEIDITTVAPTVYTAMRATIKTKFASPDTTTFTNLTRASVVDKLVLPVGATTDAAKEELIGKIINLTKVGKQSGDFAIIVLSQTINDIGGPGGTSIAVYKVPVDGSAALPVTCTIGTFDIATGSDSATWTDDAYGDEITGEQKIMVKLNSSDSGTITIKSFQYID